MAVSPSGHLLTTLNKAKDRIVLFDADGPRGWPEGLTALGDGDIEAAPDGSFWLLASGGLHIYSPAVSATR